MSKTPYLAIILVLVLGACRPFSIFFVEPSGPPEYQLGWQDGCDTGMSAEGSWYYKTMFGFKKRTELAANDQYKQGWNEGFTYCRFALDGAQTPGEWRNIGLGDGF